MKKFKVTMLATSIKEIFVAAKDKADAINKVDKYYLDEEKINFDDEDIKQLRYSCKEIISKRRDRFTAQGYDLPNNNADVFINEILNTFDKAEKNVCKEVFLQLKITNEDIKNLENLYSQYKEDLQ